MTELINPRWNKKYVEHVLEPHFKQAQKHFLIPLLEINRAHALMLLEVGLLEQPAATKILAALETTPTLEYSINFEDLFFVLEAHLLEKAGAEIAGNLHIARSRNDVDAALIRMILRQECLEIIRTLEAFCEVLHSKALEGSTWLMPGYTHHQPAQPTTLGHYLTGVLEVLQRDLQRFKAAYTTINASPLGAVAMTGTGFAINRTSMMVWLGFDTILENATDAVGAADHSLELLSAIIICNTTLSRLTHDLIFWAAQETSFFRVADAFVQISSVMPQKRNPVVLEHIRAKLARAGGTARTAFDLTNNIPFGDVNDVAEPLLPVTLSALEDSRAALELLSAVLATSSFNTNKMRDAASKHFMTATGLADALVSTGLTFKKAHGIVSKIVDYAMQHQLQSHEITAAMLQSLIGISLTDEFIQKALDPQAFVECRTLLGGSAPSTVQTALEQHKIRLEQTKTWRCEQIQHLEQAQSQLRAAIEEVKT